MSHYKLMTNRHEHTAVRGDRAPSREITQRAGPATRPSVTLRVGTTFGILFHFPTNTYLL